MATPTDSNLAAHLGIQDRLDLKLHLLDQIALQSAAASRIG